MQVRFASPDDMPRILQLGAELHKNVPYSYIAYSDDSQHALGFMLASNLLLVAEDDGGVFGVIGGVSAPVTFNPSKVFVQELIFWVTPSKANKGAGKALLEGFELAAKAVGADVLFVSSLKTQLHKKTKKLYESMGFKEAEVAYAKRVT